MNIGKIKLKLNMIRALWPTLTAPKIFNWMGYRLNKKILPEWNYFSPVSLDIEPTINCNLSCAFCHNKNLVRDKRSIDLDDFKDILSNFPRILRLNIQGMGEPLLNPELPDMIRYAKEKKNFVTLTTNGTLLNKDMAEKLVQSGIDRILISLDAPQKEIYERVRPGANFEAVIDNVRGLTATRGKRKKPLVYIWMLGTRESISQVEKMINLAGDLGVDGLVLQMNLTGWGKDEWDEKVKDLKADYATVEEKLFDFQKLAKRKNIIFNINKDFTYFKKSRRDRCGWFWGGAYVSSDGQMPPCCLVADPKVFSFGNIFIAKFKDIRNSDKYREMRKKIKNGDYPDFCNNCIEKKL